MVEIIPKIVMIRELRNAVYDLETGAIEHFRKAAFRRVEGNIRKTLVLSRRFLTQEHPRFLVREAHALYQQTFARKRTKVSDCRKGAFQVIEQTEAQNQVELPEIPDVAGFYVPQFKWNLGEPSACFVDIVLASVEGADLEPTFAENFRKEANPTSSVQRS